MSSSRLSRVGRLLRRRGWLLVVCTLLSAAVAATLDSGAARSTFTASAVLFVPSGASVEGPGNAFEANQLAANYAELIPRDEAVLDHVSAASGIDRDDVSDAIAVSTVTDTSIVRVSITAADAETAVAAVAALTNAVTSNGVEVPSIPPGSIERSALDTSATENTGRDVDAVLIGAILGFILGLTLMVIWERSDARIDEPATLRDLLGAPVSDMEVLTADAVDSLVDQWGNMTSSENRQVALVGVMVGQQVVTGSVARRLAVADDSFNPGLSAPTSARHRARLTFVVAGAPGTSELGESVVFESGMVVLVVKKGTPIATVEAAAEVLGQIGNGPHWGILASDRPQRAARSAKSVRATGGAGSRFVRDLDDRRRPAS